MLHLVCAFFPVQFANEGDEEQRLCEGTHKELSPQT